LSIIRQFRKLASHPNMIGSLAQSFGPFVKHRKGDACVAAYAPFNIANLMSIQQRERSLAQMLAKRGLMDLRGLEILDVGCGWGSFFLQLMLWGASPRLLHGIDRLAERVAVARTRHPELDVLEGTAAALPWENERFDIVSQFTTFTSILDDGERRSAAREIDRVLKPNGILVWYDFWLNPSNPNTHPVRPAELRTLFPAYHRDLRRVTLAPPIARAVAPRSRILASLLQEVWALQSHLLGVLIKS
jgi:ubiquinone/menaquinone biosynthesis C-methylase UbiE